MSDISLTEALETVLGPIPPERRSAGVARLQGLGVTPDQLLSKAGAAKDMLGRNLTFREVVHGYHSLGRVTETPTTSGSGSIQPMSRRVQIETADERRREALSHWDNAVPPKQAGASIPAMSSAHPRHPQSVLDALVEFCAAPPTGTLLITGATGVGKSFAAWAVAKRLAGLYGMRVTGSDVPRFMADLSDRSSNVDRNRDFYVRAELLLLDELGSAREADTAFRTEMIQSLLVNRDDQLRPTILVSNLDLAELEKRLGDRIMDRLLAGDTIEMAGTTRRVEGSL